MFQLINCESSTIINIKPKTHLLTTQYMFDPTLSYSSPKVVHQNINKNKNPGVQIQQLFSLSYIQKLIEAEKQTPNIFRLNQKCDFPLHQFRYQSEIQKFLSLPFAQRTAKIIKNSKHLMRDFECFQVQKNSRNSLNNTHQKAQKHQDHALIKKDIESILSVFSMYSQVSYYSKGQIIDVTGWKKSKIRILLKGQVGIYEPTNKKAMINCVHKIKENQNQNSTPLCIFFNNWATTISNGQIPVKQLAIQLSKRCNNQTQNEKENDYIQEKFFRFILGPQNKQSLTNQNCEQILKVCQILSPMTPHKYSTIVQKQGELLVPQSKSTSILYQSLDSQTAFTSVCLSSEAVVIELDFPIFRQILWLINIDQQKLYLTSLMNKFSSLQYFQAQKYLKKKQNMIDYLASKNSSTSKANQSPGKLPSNISLNSQNNLEVSPSSSIQLVQQNMTIQQKKQSVQLKKNSSLQTQSSSLYFTIPYNRTPYLIVEGEVVLVINKVKQQKLIDDKYSLPRKTYIRHQLLKLYQNDIFGFQIIGQQKQFSLRYQVRKDSKILKINKSILKKQIQQIPGFQIQFHHFKLNRDRILSQILDKLSKQIQNQMINKYSNSHSFRRNTQQQKTLPKQIIHFQIPDKELLKQQLYQTQISIDNNQKQLIRKQTSKSFPSLPNYTKNYETKSIDTNSVKFSSKKQQFALNQRKVSDQKSPEKYKIHDVEYIGSQKYPEIQRQLLEKLSIKERKRYSANHQKRLTVELLKEFNLVGFKNEGEIGSSENAHDHPIVEMRDPVTGVLLRRRSIPSIKNIQGLKNRQKIEKTIMRKIGLLTEAEKVNHNQKVVKSRKSQIKYENLQEMRRKQQKRLFKIQKSLPKLQNLYSKQADIKYKNKGTTKL